MIPCSVPVQSYTELNKGDMWLALQFSIVVSEQFGCLATSSQLWWLQYPKVTWSLFTTFPSGLPQAKSIGKLAGDCKMLLQVAPTTFLPAHTSSIAPATCSPMVPAHAQSNGSPMLYSTCSPHRPTCTLPVQCLWHPPIHSTSLPVCLPGTSVYVMVMWGAHLMTRTVLGLQKQPGLLWLPSLSNAVMLRCTLQPHCS